jgi:hypothetical protein
MVSTEAARMTVGVLGGLLSFVSKIYIFLLLARIPRDLL